ncbi:UNVERIFIED_CONTAM: 11S globulin seed storage protein Ana o [Sesamum latifolium]|uniref:11S globulin seed storage protein Ana o n=1 Tax=Sesamum latifolium TaxID=2727402 RepID=A0AAW2Y107_9LAMI
MLSTEEYLRWRVLCLEKGIQNLSFRPGGVDSLVQIIDLKNSPGTASKEAIVADRLFMDAVDHKCSVLVYGAQYFKPTADHKKAGISSYATAENLLIEYGGLKRENDTEFSTDDKVLEVNIRPGTTELIQIPTNEVGVTLTWDVTVIGYEVGYKEEFVPDDDCSYIVLIQEKKMLESIRNSFHIREPGKIVITIVNGAYTKKKAFYRWKPSEAPQPCRLQNGKRLSFISHVSNADLCFYSTNTSTFLSPLLIICPTKSIYYSSSFHHHTFLSILFHIMVKLFLSVLSLLLLFGFGSAVRGGTWQQGECQIRSINAREPSYSLQAEGGVTEFWDFKNDEFQCAGVSLRRHRLQPRALMLPLYHNAPVLVYVVQGRGIYGLMISGCPETFESSQRTEEQSQEERRQRFRDRHQKIEEFREGDIVAIPAGAAHWAYNDGDQELVVVVLHDNTNNVNQLDQNPRSFLIAGNPERGQEQQQGSRRGQRELGNVFRGFDVHMPPFRRREYGREEEEGYYGGDNGLEETICNAKIRENLDKPSRADVYNPRAGRFSTVNSLTSQFLASSNSAPPGEFFTG